MPKGGGFRAVRFMIEEVTESDWQSKVVQAPGLVLVDFYATWCPSCKTIAPMLEQVAEEMAGVYETYKVNIDSADRIVRQVRLTKIPTMVVIRNGREVARREGSPTKRELLDALKKIARV